MVSIRQCYSCRRTVWLAALIAATLAGCGDTHTQTGRATRRTIVGININGPGAAVVGTGSPNRVVLAPPRSLGDRARVLFRLGAVVAGESGCLACHVIGAAGNNGPGPPLTHIGARLSRVEITRVLLNPTAPMPSFAGLSKPKLHALTAFLADLR